MPRILIVDDHEIMRRGLRQVVAEGFPDAVTGEAGDAASALEALERERWDLVLLDVNLPGRSGIELLGDLQTRWRSLPVLMLSAYPEEDFAVRCIQRGASGYLTKTSASQELVAAVRKVLAGGRYVTASLAERLASVLGGQLEPAPEDALSARELQVLRGVAAGRTLKEIAAELGLSEKTVGTYRARLSSKLGLSTNVELTRYAMRRGLVD